MSYLAKPENPCKKDCPFRDTYCRLDCEDYIEFEEKYKQYQEARLKQIKKNGEIVEYRKALNDKFKRRKGRHG